MLVTALQGVRILAAAGGYDHSVVIGEHSVYSFGFNECGELGHCDVEPRESPTIIEHLHGMHIHSVSAGHNASIATTVNGEAYGWGVGVEYVAPGLPHIPHQLLGLELHADQLVPLLYPNLQMCMHGL
jgi:alpha-tubulin suppressor-like RCC1 family protein